MIHRFPQSCWLATEERKLWLTSGEIYQLIVVLDDTLLKKLPGIGVDISVDRARVDLISAGASLLRKPITIGRAAIPGSACPYWLSRDLISPESATVLRSYADERDIGVLDQLLSLDASIRARIAKSNPS